MFPAEEARTPENNGRFDHVNRFNLTLGVVALVWTLIIGGLGYWHYNRVAAGFFENARTAARASIEKDITFRRWATSHGGVYVPQTEQTPPNPYLSHIPERDITTPSGRDLTLMNPAYMTRQVHELANETFGARGHITSLNPLRPENAADDWERQSLHAFAAGAEEQSSLVTEGDTTLLRLMLPFYVEQGCLRCHGAQGYAVGDLIGGISVGIDWQPYQKALTATWGGYVIGYGGIWLLGLVFTEVHRRRLRAFLRYRHQSALEQKQLLGRFQKLAAHLPGMIYQYRLYPDGRSCFPYASDGIRHIYGVTPEQVREDASAVFAVLHPDDAERVAASIKRSAADRTVWRDEYRVVHPDGHELWVEGYSTPEQLADGSILWHGYIRDIDDRKLSQQLVEEQSRMLKRRNDDLEQFSYTVSHELRTPLVTAENLLGFVQQKLAGYRDESVGRHLGLIRDAARRMNQLLDSLMQLFRIDTNPQAATTTPVAELITQVIGPLRGLLGSKVDIRQSGELDSFALTGDVTHFAEIWKQLLDNALTYSREQKQPLVEVGVKRDAGEPVFYVRDNGCGIEPDYQQRIFGLFDKLDPGRGGSGLGLALVKRIVELYDGRIWVESAGAGQGSCFFFTLPAAVNRPLA